MKKLERNILDEAILQAGLSEEQAGEVVRGLRVGLARQASKDPGGKIRLDDNTLKELEETIRIGANIPPDKASKAVENIKKKIKELNDPVVEFLDDGTFDVGDAEDDIHFKMS
jgi:hypothetical protein